jgi:predicted RNA-binding protein associated with RNAse of E/G family
MDEDALAQALAQSAHVTAQAIAESAQNTVAAITALAQQPQEPIRMHLTRNAEGGLDGVAI